MVKPTPIPNAWDLINILEADDGSEVIVRIYMDNFESYVDYTTIFDDMDDDELNEAICDWVQLIQRSIAEGLQTDYLEDNIQ